MDGPPLWCPGRRAGGVEPGEGIGKDPEVRPSEETLSLLEGCVWRGNCPSVLAKSPQPSCGPAGCSEVLSVLEHGDFRNERGTGWVAGKPGEVR